MLKHLIDIESLSVADISLFLKHAHHFIRQNQLIIPPEPLLKNKIIVNLFFENSTRTLYSFEIAEKKLGAHAINFNAKYSSLNKCETLHDTALNLAAIGADCFVIRHPENGAAKKMAEIVEDEVCIINGGDGTGAHPTQALLDIFTILQHKPKLEDLSVAIIGDVKHSRVAHSLIMALQKLGTKDIRTAGPPELIPAQNSAKVFDTLESAIENVDVIVMLRIQRERLAEDLNIDVITYFQRWGLTEKKLKLAKFNAIVMHPGPINREIEIASSVADGAQSVIFEQPRNGVAVRMAVLTTLLTNEG